MNARSLSHAAAIAAAATLATGAAHAAVVSSYTAGVSPTAGTTGAADPTTQGWASAGTATAFSHGLDSSNGGWRITDGTTAQPYFYSKALASGDAADMAADGWVATWTVAVNHDAINSGGGGADNYYSVGTADNNAMWIEVAGQFRYILTHKIDANDDILIGDGTTDYQVTTANNQLSEELGGGFVARYVTFTLSYDAGAGAATLTDSEGNNHGVVATSGAAGTDRVVWGATSSGGQGSTTWNALSIDVVPEPASLALLAPLSVALLGRRRRA